MVGLFCQNFLHPCFFHMILVAFLLIVHTFVAGFGGFFA